MWIWRFWEAELLSSGVGLRRLCRATLAERCRFVSVEVGTSKLLEHILDCWDFQDFLGFF